MSTPNIIPIDQCKTLQELFSVPERWTKYYFARDVNNERVFFESEAASCFCLAGACKRLKLKDEKIVQICHKVPGMNIAAFNDNPDTTFEDIQKVIKELDL